MFVLELTYTVPLERVQPLLEEHMGWVKTQYEAGVFVASGRKEPRDGGVILALGQDREAIEKLVAEDPFSVAGVCEYRVTQFLATSVAPVLEGLREQAST
ncbi:YciI family protein [Kribbella sancticallisti]|uniref:YciI family protein n=1 Tax=Kribbella sancticallisti TaxID=460087 RepID=A0ABP4PU20_9ACTN